MKPLLVALLIFTSVACCGQYPYDAKRDNIWLFGYNDGTNPHPLFGVTQLKFDADSFAISKVDSFADFQETVAIACDSEGKLLFSTNGIWLYDSTFNKTLTSDTLNPGSWAEANTGLGYPVVQGALILKKPESSSLYYVFHARLGDNGRSEGVYYTIVDMSIHSAITLNVPIVSNTILENGKLAACRHANGRDWWILFWKAGSNMYRRLLFNPQGVSDFGWSSVGIPLSSNLGFGQNVFSPDGSKYIQHNIYYSYVIDVYDFNRCTGQLTNNIHIIENDTCYSGGCAISQDGKRLYVACSQELFQYDLTSNNIQNSRTTVALWDGFVDPDFSLGATYFHLLGLTPDGKIICNTPNSTKYLHSIEYPDSLGASCQVQQHNLNLFTFNSGTIPNYPNFRLGPVDGSACDTLGIDVGIHENAKAHYTAESVLQAYPNPAANYCNIGFGNTLKQDGALIVYDLNGRKVFEASLQKATIGYTLKTEDYTSGLYLCVVYEGNTEKGRVRFVKE
ncbi:MAG: T9SS type A sorting domain-containing protein [Chitinophagales bacterium]